MQDRNYLTLDGVTAIYDGATAVDNLTLEIAKGELVTFLGPSGCGKTTTLRMIAGFIRPANGRVLLGRRDITSTPVYRRNIGMVFQSYALFPHLNARDNVGFGLRMRGLDRAGWRKRAQATLDLVGLGDFADRYPAALSGGQQQRVALARALVIEPEVLLLDEPLSNLDANLRAGMRNEIRQLQQRLGITTVFVTHDQQEALAVSDRIVVMNAGRIAEVGTPRALCDAPHSPFTAGFLGARSVLEGELRDGIFHRADIRISPAPVGAGAAVLRASRLRLRPVETPATGGFDMIGTLRNSVYVGESFEVEVETSAGPVNVTVPSSEIPPVQGSRVRVVALEGGVSFISA
ncbi:MULTISPECIES: ABC transporter ATP-binding protein [unclassified Haematobacter]|uniref:ABC transporter ATP-binding protein n=1 Tax=unclassified Haematobacter TaxID=2640585 RepID=UPI0025B95082|nr:MULTISPECIES: ABC transporter ATP-binding protein [unclassified Haematobacter]